MKDRFYIWWLNGRLLRKHKIKATYHCAYEGCPAKISTLRFLLLGCECRMHRWIRRWGGLES